MIWTLGKKNVIAILFLNWCLILYLTNSPLQKFLVMLLLWYGTLFKRCRLMVGEGMCMVHWVHPTRDAFLYSNQDAVLLLIITTDQHNALQIISYHKKRFPCGPHATEKQEQGASPLTAQNSFILNKLYSSSDITILLAYETSLSFGLFCLTNQEWDENKQLNIPLTFMNLGKNIIKRLT